MVALVGDRIVRAARVRGIPIALLDQGATRADAEMSFKLAGRCAERVIAAA